MHPAQDVHKRSYLSQSEFPFSIYPELSIKHLFNIK